MSSFVGIVDFGVLIQIDRRTGIPTGLIKPNTPGDPDYIPPQPSNVLCLRYKTEWVPDEDTAYCEVYESYGNDIQSVSLQKTNCSMGYEGSMVTYTILPNSFFASTQIEADTLAINYMNATKETYMLSNGTCTPLSLPFKWVPDETTAYCQQDEETYSLHESSYSYSGGDNVANIRIVDRTTGVTVSDKYNGGLPVYPFDLVDDGGLFDIYVNNIYGSDMFVDIDGNGFHSQVLVSNGNEVKFGPISKVGSGEIFVTLSDLI